MRNGGTGYWPVCGYQVHRKRGRIGGLVRPPTFRLGHFTDLECRVESFKEFRGLGLRV